MCSISTCWVFYEKHVLSLKKRRSYVSECARWRHINEYLNDCQISEITPLKILTLTTNLYEKKLSPQTVRHCLSLLQRVIIKAKKMEIYKGSIPIFEFPRFDNKRTRFLTKIEVRQLLQALQLKSQIWHDITIVAVLTGLRASEIFNIRVENFDKGNKLLHVLDTKTNLSRTIPLNKQVCKLLNTYSKINSSGYLFTTKDGKKISLVSKIFRQAVADCKFNVNVDDRRNAVVFHTLRHTFASWLVQNGSEIQIVGKLLGHASIQMTMRYAHLNPDQGAKAVSRLSL